MAITYSFIQNFITCIWYYQAYDVVLNSDHIYNTQKLPLSKVFKHKKNAYKNIKLCEHYANVHKEKHWIIIISSELFSF